MTDLQDARIRQFFADHHADLVLAFEQAYAVAGGHYDELAPEDRRRQAETDSREFAADLVAGTVNRTLIDEVIRMAADSTALARDLVRMVMAIDPLICGLIRLRLAHDPILAAEMERRTRNIVATFRAGVVDAQIGHLLGRIKLGGRDS